MLDVKAAERFMSASKGMGSALDELPETKAHLQSIIDAAKNSDEGIKIATKLNKDVTESQRARLFLGRDPQVAFKKALYDANSPATEMGALVKEANADSSGVALAGLKRFGAGEVISGALHAAKTSPDGMTKWMSKNHKALSQLYSPAEMKNIDRIVEDAAKIMNSNKRATVGSDTVENSLLQNILSAMAAGTGSSSTKHIPFGLGKSLIAQTQGAKLGRALARGLNNTQRATLIREGLLDPELGKELLQRPTNPLQMKRLRGHLYNMGVDIDEMMQEEEQQPPPQTSVVNSGLNFV
jgi:hypothetical protein